MEEYFTISEFAKLRNININSLRYYEKTGVLKPAYVDPHNGYRYYSPEQVSILDVILLCINFGMPLKELTKYISNNAFIENKALFETGKRIAQQRLRDVKAELDKIEYTLQYLNHNQQYNAQTGPYEREIPERTVITADYTGALPDIRKIEMASGKLYSYAQEKKLSPVFPAGLLLQFDGAKVRTKIFFQVVAGAACDKAVMKIPQGKFLCRQVDLTPEMDLMNVIDATMGTDGTEEIIISNMLLYKYQIGTRKSEFQKRTVD